MLAYQGVSYGLQGRVNIKDFGQYLYWALEGEEEDCTRVACGIISDIVAALGNESEQYLSSLVPHLLNVLQSAKRERKTKLIAFQSLSDVAFYAGPSFCKNYLPQSLIILRSASVLSCQTNEYQNDPDALEYL